MSSYWFQDEDRRRTVVEEDEEAWHYVEGRGWVELTGEVYIKDEHDDN